MGIACQAGPVFFAAVSRSMMQFLHFAMMLVGFMEYSGTVRGWGQGVADVQQVGVSA